MDTSITSPVPLTEPAYAREADTLAMQMAHCDIARLGAMLRLKPRLASEVYRYYQEFHSPDAPTTAALLAYTGIVFKYLRPRDFTAEQFAYTADHLYITSFLYGLLRPTDGIRLYRLEGSVKLPDDASTTVFAYWRDGLTPLLTDSIARCGGILCNLASDEMRRLFHWHEVEKSAKQIITPTFYVYKEGRPTTVVVYTKMARGAMTRFIMTNRITNPDELQSFEWEGFRYSPEMSTRDNPVFVL